MDESEDDSTHPKLIQDFVRIVNTVHLALDLKRRLEEPGLLAAL